MKNLIITIFCLFFFSGCDLLTNTGQQSQLLWQTVLSDGKLIEGTMSITLVEDKIVALGMQNTKSTILGIDRVSGKIQWRWSDFFLTDKSMLVDYLYSYNNYLVVNNTIYNYGLNISNGSTAWSHETPRSIQWGSHGATGIGPRYFYSISGNSGIVIMGNMLTGQQQELLKYPKSIAPQWITAFVASNSDTMLAITSLYGEVSTNFRNKAYLTLYNLSRRQKIYELLQAEADSLVFNVLPDGPPVIYRNKIICSIGATIQANDIESGKIQWKTRTDADFWLSGVLIAGDKIIGNSSNGTLYALNPEDGRILWQVKTSGSTRTPFYMNGIIYIIGGGDGLLYAINEKDGTILWKIASPDNASNKQTFFTGVVTGKDGKIYASSYLNLYCYKAAR